MKQLKAKPIKYGSIFSMFQVWDQLIADSFGIIIPDNYNWALLWADLDNFSFSASFLVVPELANRLHIDAFLWNTKSAG